MTLRKNAPKTCWTLLFCLTLPGALHTVPARAAEPTGDKVLVDLANQLKRNLRRDDTAYRYGGEEMVVLLPGAALDAAEGLAERLRKRVVKANKRTVIASVSAS